MQVELIALLSKYSVDCVATALVVFMVMYLIKKKCNPPDKLNQLLPFCLSFAVYCVAAALGKFTTDLVVSKSFTAGGLATMLYAFSGGYSTYDRDIREMLVNILKTLTDNDSAESLADKILDDLSALSNEDDGLKTVRISDLIKSQLSDDADAEQVKFVSAVFVHAFDKLSASKTKRKQ